MPALLLAGCAGGVETGAITEIAPQTGAQGPDVYASRRAAGEVVPAFAGSQVVEVRTVRKSGESYGPDADGSDIPGATCIVKARDFSAEVTTPGKVRVPLYRRQSSTLAVQCQKKGFEPAMAEFAAYNATEQNRRMAGSAAGLVGFLVVSAMNASDEDQHEFAYPDVKVEMGRAKPGAANAN